VNNPALIRLNINSRPSNIKWTGNRGRVRRAGEKKPHQKGSADAPLVKGGSPGPANARPGPDKMCMSVPGSCACRADSPPGLRGLPLGSTPCWQSAQLWGPGYRPLLFGAAPSPGAQPASFRANFRGRPAEPPGAGFSGPAQPGSRLRPPGLGFGVLLPPGRRSRPGWV